ADASCRVPGSRWSSSDQSTSSSLMLRNALLDLSLMGSHGRLTRGRSCPWLAVEMARHAMAVRRLAQGGHFLGTSCEGVRAAVAEAAAGRRLPGIGDVAADRQRRARL